MPALPPSRLPGPILPALVILAPALLAPALLPAPLAAQDPSTTPCSGEEYRQFDFWVGEWDVHRPDGTLAGRNTIRRVMGGCVLHERYEGAEGPYEGESFNTWDSGRGVWHQTWVDNGGLLLRIEGGLRNGVMVMEGTTRGPDGGATVNRITWSVIDGDPDRVRQFWQTSTDGGETWTVAFDGEYRRRAEGSDR